MGYHRQRLYREVEGLLCRRPDLRLNAVAERLGIERHTISRLVKSFTGMSFRDYRRKNLLSIAFELLNRPDLSVKQVAIALGYNHPRDFSRFFRTETGETPTEYRAQRQSTYLIQRSSVAMKGSKIRALE